MRGFTWFWVQTDRYGGSGWKTVETQAKNTVDLGLPAHRYTGMGWDVDGDDDGDGDDDDDGTGNGSWDGMGWVFTYLKILRG